MEYACPKDFFSIALPAEAETTTWQTADGSESDAIRFPAVAGLHGEFDEPINRSPSAGASFRAAPAGKPPLPTAAPAEALQICLEGTGPERQFPCMYQHTFSPKHTTRPL
jgi:hypothetical protein